jgi:hypothetical protein
VLAFNQRIELCLPRHAPSRFTNGMLKTWRSISAKTNDRNHNIVSNRFTANALNGPTFVDRLSSMLPAHKKKIMTLIDTGSSEVLRIRIVSSCSSSRLSWILRR